VKNLISNAIVAYQFAKINPITFINQSIKKVKELIEYQNLSKEYNKIKFLLNGTNGAEQHKMKIKLNSLQKQLESHPFHDLIKDGQFSLIIEDVNIEDVAHKGQLARMIENGFNHNSFTKKAKKYFDIATVAKNTKIYKGLLQATQYGDIVTRQIVYEKMQSDYKKKGQTLTGTKKRDALNFLDQLFVNYSYIDNRFLKFADNVMFLFFTKYYLRQAKALFSVAVNNPSRYFFSLFATDYLHNHVTSMEESSSGRLYEAGLDVRGPSSTYSNSPIDAMKHRDVLYNLFFNEKYDGSRLYTPFYLDNIIEWNLFKGIIDR